MSEDVYKRRRRRLAAQVGQGGIVILPAGTEKTRNRDVLYPFRQDSDFGYLTGFPEPDAFMVLKPGDEEAEYRLFCHPRDPEHEQWEGRRIGPDGAEGDFGAERAHPLDDLDQVLPALLEGVERVYYPLGRDAELDRRLTGWINRVRAKARAGIRAPSQLGDLGEMVHEMRLFKSPEELEIMRRAANVTSDAHRNAMRRCRSSRNERELEAGLIFDFNLAGGSWAYPPIVAGGANACVLHYTENDQPLPGGELLLIDAGAEIDGYAADITRTFPVDGRFSPAQAEVYQVVLDAQLAAIAAVQPGNDFDAPHRAALRVIVEGLVDLGLLRGEVDALIEEGTYRRFFMHRTGHWMGRDVHDVGSYKIDGRWRDLEPGMVLTIEPGIYIPADPDIPEQFRHIGIRIEDDLVVTRDGHENLTADTPKTLDEIEAWMAGE